MTRQFISRETDLAATKWSTERPGLFRERVSSRLIEKGNGCWIWPGSRVDGTYGQVRIPAEVDPNGRRVLVHRAMYLARHGRIPDGYVVDHDGLCPTATESGGSDKSCCNPAHLRAVPPLVNMTITGRGVAAEAVARTHCIRGHLLAGANLVARKPRDNGSVKRGCRTCAREKKGGSR